MKRTLTLMLTALVVAATAGQALALNPQPLPPRRVPHLRVHRVFPSHHRRHHGGDVVHSVFTTHTGAHTR